MKIVALTAENVKRLHAVHITPDGNVVTIGGKNGQGKTSVLDSIAMVLGGKGEAPPEPIRRGEKRARIEAKLDGLVVERVFKANGDTDLVVKGADGTRFASPQKVLDELVGQLSFDPLEFARMEKKEQVATLRGVVQLDFTEIDQRRDKAYEQRTEVGRELKRLTGAREKLTTYGDAPKERVDVSAVASELGRLQSENKARAEKEHKLEALRAQGKAAEAEIERLRAEVDRASKRCDDIAAAFTALKAEVIAMPTHDVNALLEQVAQAETINRKVDANARATELDAEIEVLTEQAMKLTEQVDGAEEEKRDLLAAAKFPVEGLAFGDDGVSFKGLPFEQAAASEKIRVSVAIGIALNPKLRVLLIRDGSLLDDDAMKVLGEMAGAHDMQVWVERVGKGEECAVIIEDGQVLGAPPVEDASPAKNKPRAAPRVAKEEPGADG